VSSGDELVVDGEVRVPFHAPSRTGVVGDFLDAAEPHPTADHGTVISRDDDYRASIPLADLRRGLLDEGRLTIPDGRTLCWNVKDVIRIEVTTGKQPDSVPENPPH